MPLISYAVDHAVYHLIMPLIWCRWKPSQFDVAIPQLYLKCVFQTKGTTSACFKIIENVDGIGFFLKKKKLIL